MQQMQHSFRTDHENMRIVCGGYGPSVSWIDGQVTSQLVNPSKQAIEPEEKLW